MARKSRKNMMPQAAVQEAVQQNEKELLRTAAYARLSVENGGHETEDSLHTQILQIHNYIRENPELTLTDTYADNGFTGTRFDRPEFERMMQDIRTGKIQCIVVNWYLEKRKLHHTKGLASIQWKRRNGILLKTRMKQSF